MQYAEEKVLSLLYLTAYCSLTQCSMGVTLPCYVPSKTIKKERLGHTECFSVVTLFFLSSQLTTLPADSPAAHIQDEHIQRNLTVDNFWKEAYH